MTKQEIEERVSVIITKKLERPAPPMADIRDDLGADSLDLLEIEMEVAREFGAEVSIKGARTARLTAGSRRGRRGRPRRAAKRPSHGSVTAKWRA